MFARVLKKLAERQKTLQTLCDKIMVYADGSIILEGLIQMKDSAFVEANCSSVGSAQQYHGSVR